MLLLTIMPPLMAWAWWSWPETEETPRTPSFDELVDLIVSTVHPNPWDEVGGPGAIDEFETRCVLIVDADEYCDDLDLCERTHYSDHGMEYDDGSSSASPTAAVTDDPFAL
jgi:hypothetical protein